MRRQKLAGRISLLTGAVNVGILQSGSKALLIDCCDRVGPAQLAKLGIRTVDRILATQHRRPNVAGAGRLVEEGASLVVPEVERSLFEDVQSFWADWRNRWHLFEQLPSQEVLAEPVPVTRGVRGGDALEWEGAIIHVLETPGFSPGGVTYVVKDGDQTVAFCGDLLCGNGGLWDLSSLQAPWNGLHAYHAFLGAREMLCESLHKLTRAGPHLLVPSHGRPIRDLPGAARLLEERLHALWRNYASISSVHHYYPQPLADVADDPDRMSPAETIELPPWVRRVDYTSYAVVSESGAALLLDCGHDRVIDRLNQWLRSGAISRVECCWVTHYHNDHVSALPNLVAALGVPIVCDSSLAEILEAPARFNLPCLFPGAIPVSRSTRHGESWDWQEFRLTAYHFPGQTEHHGGLLVEGRGLRVFFAGDSGSPSGLDDYCLQNRSLLGAAKGSRFCLELLETLRPDCIVNQHQARGFRFTSDQLARMHEVLEKREEMIRELAPWDDANFAIDPGWLRTYPFEQDAWPGTVVKVECRVTNHSHAPATLHVSSVPPRGWRTVRDRRTRVRVEARQEGSVQMEVRVPLHAPSGRAVIPVRVAWNGRYLGQVRHALVNVLTAGPTGR